MMVKGLFFARLQRASRAGLHPRRRQTGLYLLAVFLGVSGAIRLGTGVGLAFAETTKPQTAATASASAEQSTDASSAPVENGAGACAPDLGALAMLQSLKDREGRLAEQEGEAAEKEQTLTLARVEVDKKIVELQVAEAKLAATIAIADQAADKDVSQLVAVYESMKPKDAARLFGEMDPDFAAGFLAKMRPEAAAAVMSGLDPQKAYLISVKFAGRNANAPKS